MSILRRLSLAELRAQTNDPVDPDAERIASEILVQIREQGDVAVERYAEKFGDLREQGKFVYTRNEMKRVFDSLSKDRQQLLERTAARIKAFAECQRASIKETSLPIPGGVARQQVSPVAVAGCYAPGGNYPLPSSALMTAVTARTAGVEKVILASPKAADITIAAAYVAGADCMLSLGGAQAIGALAYGYDGLPACDVIVGPGNRFVTAAKKIVSGVVGIDMLAGPSELIVVADETADAEVIAADLLAQAEHSKDARPFLITTSSALADDVDAALARQLSTLPTAAIARPACNNGAAIVVSSIDEAIAASDILAPEHLEVMTANAAEVATRFRHFGGIFIGTGSAEVLGDYGAGPNHTLPTGGCARFIGGLSVFNFLRIRTSLEMTDLAAARAIVEDTIALAREEGLEGHARSATKRLLS